MTFLDAYTSKAAAAVTSGGANYPLPHLTVGVLLSGF